MSRRRRALDDLEADIRDHIERETQENLERGLPPDEARRQAMLTFGNVALAKEAARAVWIPVWFEQLVQDARDAVRTLRRNPGFATVVVLTLALAIGMNTAVFSVFNGVLLRPIPYPDSNRLVWLSLHGDTPFNAMPITEFAAWREQATSFELMVAYENTQDHTLQTPDGGTQVRNAWVSHDFWALTGARPALGRLPEPGEDDVLILSHGFFERWFESDPAVLGRVVTMPGGRQLTIVGVLARDFRLQLPQEALGPALELRSVDVYRPYGGGTARGQPRGTGVLVPVRVVAKLAPNATIEQARTELETIRSRLAQASPVPFLDEATLRAVPLQEQLVGRARPALWLLLAAVALVLLIACANVANLLLARASARQRELAVRVSVGAGRARVMRQFLAESLVLALLGGAAGLLLASWSLDAIVSLMPAEAMPRLADVTIDGRVLAFVLGASLLTAFLFGLAPALILQRVNPQDVLKQSAARTSATSRGLRGRRGLVAIQLALAVVLLSGAGLMVKSFWRMHTHPPGFDPERVLTMKVTFTAPDYVPGERRHAYVDELLGRVHGVPGVEAAAITATGGASPLVHVAREGAPPPAPDRESSPLTHVYAASAAYARAIGLRLVSGRWFTDAEPAPGVVISESVARRYLGGVDDAIGRRIQICYAAAPGAPCPVLVAPILGVVGDLKYARLDAGPNPEIYVPYRHYPRGFFQFTAVVRTAADPLASAAEIRKQITDIDRTLPIVDVMTLERALADSIAPRRFNLLLLSAFAAAALLLALIGIYGVTAYVVAQRTPEIGVRMALGARRIQIVRMVAGDGMRPAAAGILIGLAGALALTRFLETLLYDVQPTDPQTFAVVAALLGATVLIACCGPAIKAALVDPIIALRSE
jgi:putative ABC transport system permease protein